MDDAFTSGEPEVLKPALTRLFASIPYHLHIEAEKYYHSIFFALLKFLGFDVQAEVSVAGGRIDGVLETHDKIYILEMKYEKCGKDASTEEKRGLLDKGIADAFRQIHDKNYAAPYAGGGKEVIEVAVAVTGGNDVSVRSRRGAERLTEI
jgi:opacity protein-like surface antigen